MERVYVIINEVKRCSGLPYPYENRIFRLHDALSLHQTWVKMEQKPDATTPRADNQVIWPTRARGSVRGIVWDGTDAEGRRVRISCVLWTLSARGADGSGRLAEPVTGFVDVGKDAGPDSGCGGAS